MKHCTVLPIKDQRLCMSEVSNVVFVVFTQHCIQSNVTHVTQVRRVEGVLHSVYSGLLTLPGGKFILAFRLGGLAVHHQSV